MFESVCFTLTGAGSTVAVFLIYRSGSAAVTDCFFKELSIYLEVLALYKCQIVVAGDLNVHVEDATNNNAVNLTDNLDSFAFTQHVPLISTHRDGGKLDLNITKCKQTLQDIVVDPPNVISDHNLIS